MYDICASAGCAEQEVLGTPQIQVAVSLFVEGNRQSSLHCIPEYHVWVYNTARSHGLPVYEVQDLTA